MNPLLKIFRVLVLCSLLFSLARIALLWLNPQDFSQLSPATLREGFIGGLRFDCAAFLPFMALPFLMLLLPFSFVGKGWWQKLWSWVSFVVFALLAILLAGSVLYFNQARRHIADELAQLGNDFHFILPFALKAHLGATVALLALLVVLALGWQRWIVRPQPLRASLLRHTLPTVCLLVLGIRGSVSLKPIAPIDAYGSGDRQLGTLMLNGVFTGTRALLTFNEIPRSARSSEELQRGLAPFGIDPSTSYPFMRAISGKKENRNIVVILLESWSHCYVDSFGGGNFQVTPFFDELAAKSTRYRNYYANGTRSIEAIQLILSGVPPLKGLPTIDQGLDLSQTPHIGSIAAARGYDNIFVQSSKRRSFRLDAVAKFLGFAAYYGGEDAPPTLPYADPQAPQFGWDYESLQLFGKKLGEAKEPFFGFMFTGTTHTPFALPPEGCRKYPHGLDSEGGFLNTLCYADWSLREFFSAVKNAPWFHNTIFILTADHTLGAYRHYSYLERQHIPLIIYDPQREVGRDDPKFASHMDLFPSIVSLMGGEMKVPSLGQPLFKEGAGSVLITGRYDNIGMISPQGYMVHSFRQVIEQQLIASCGGECRQQMIDSLLGLEHSAYAALRNKRWLENP